MIYATFVLIAILATSYGELTPYLNGAVAFSNPAFVSYVSLNKTSTDLMITMFAEMSDGSISTVSNIYDLFLSPTQSKFSVTTLGKDYTWPNSAEMVAEGVFSSAEISQYCGGISCNLVVVPDGFLTPGHKTGGIYLLPQTSSLPATKIAVAPVESNWFYHQVNWVDVDLDGKLDIVAARCSVNAFGSASGELVWLKHPSTIDKSKTWVMTKLTKGPDVITKVLQGKDKLLYVISAEFFSSKLSLSIIQPGTTPKLVSYTVLDSTLGAAYDMHLADVDGDGQSELIVSTHMSGKGGAVYAYELPSNLIPETEVSSTVSAATVTDWQRVTLGTGFKVTKSGLNQAAPGFIYPLSNPDKSSAALSKRPIFVIAGDGSQGVHLMTPVSDATNPYAYSVTKIIEIGGTVGSLAVKDINGDGYLDAVIPDYDNSKLYFYTLK